MNKLAGSPFRGAICVDLIFKMKSGQRDLSVMLKEIDGSHRVKNRCTDANQKRLLMRLQNCNQNYDVSCSKLISLIDLLLGVSMTPLR
jgi:hypothetical protein